jgi:hypothetical protein
MGLDRLTVEIAGRSAHDIDQILTLNALEYGESDIIATQADFDWRCNRNPAGPAVISVIRNRQGDVVGFIFMEHVRMRVNGENCRAAMGTNLVIQSDYRNTFGYVKLIRQFEQTLRHEGIPLHFSFVSEEYYQHLRARESQTAYTIPLLIKPLNFKAMIEAYFQGKWQHFFGNQARWLLAPFFLRKPVMRRDNEIVVRAVENIDAGFDEFWQQTRDKYPAVVIRDRAFLSWRFAPVSGRNYYTFAAYRRDRMLGYVVIRCATIRGIKTGIILDLLVGDHPLQMDAGACLMSQAEAFFRTKGMSMAAGLMVPKAVEYRILKKSGYRPLPAAISPRPYRFAFFIHNSPLERLKSLSMRDWFITFADFESH